MKLHGKPSLLLLVMRCKMDNFVKNQHYRWAFDKIKSDPEKFGGDVSNAFIQIEYAKEFYDGAVDTVIKIKTLVSISRIKNKLLLQNPQFDNRVKYKPKKRKTDAVH